MQHIINKNSKLSRAAMFKRCLKSNGGRYLLLSGPLRHAPFSWLINMTHPIQVMKLLLLIWRIASVWEVLSGPLKPDMSLTVAERKRILFNTHQRWQSFHCFHFYTCGHMYFDWIKESSPQIVLLTFMQF